MEQKKSKVKKMLGFRSLLTTRTKLGSPDEAKERSLSAEKKATPIINVQLGDITTSQVN
jgi:hypothetical protein